MAEQLETQLRELREETSYMLRAQQAALHQCITAWSTRHQQLLQELGFQDFGVLDAIGALRIEDVPDSAKRLESPIESEGCTSPLRTNAGSAAFAETERQCDPAGMTAEETDARQSGPVTEQHCEDSGSGWRPRYLSDGSAGVNSAKLGVRRCESMTWSTSNGRPSSPSSPTIAASIWSHGPRHALQRVVESAPFHLLGGVLIMVTCVMVGIETDYVAKNGGDSTPFFFVAQVILNVFFIVDVLMRLGAWGACELFYHSVDRAWNLMDLLLVVISVCDLFSQLIQISQIGAIVVFRVVRVCRLLRLVRVIKLLRMVAYVQEIRKIFLLLAASAKTLLWSLLSVLLIMYIFAVLFTEGTTSHLVSDDPTSSELQLHHDFGTIGRSIYSLYQAISAGRNWGTFIEPLSEIGGLHVGLFIAYISFTFFGVLNIVTSVFVECAMQSTQRHRDLLVEEKKAFELGHLKHMRAIFKEIDIDQSGSVEYHELKQRLGDNVSLRDYFRALELNATDTMTLFELLDQDESGSLSIDEFVDGCMRLKGEARAFDINFMIQQSRKANKRVCSYMTESCAKLSDVDTRLNALLASVQAFSLADQSASMKAGPAGDEGVGGRHDAGETWNPGCWEPQDAGAYDAPDTVL